MTEVLAADAAGEIDVAAPLHVPQLGIACALDVHGQLVAEAACKGGVKPAADAKADTPGTWGACLAHIMATTELKDQINPFFNATPHFVAACDPKDRTLMGAILLEDLMPTPPGSATPFVASQLLETDAIDYKMQLRLSVCDKGGYAIKVAEFEF